MSKIVLTRLYSISNVPNYLCVYHSDVTQYYKSHPIKVRGLFRSLLYQTFSVLIIQVSFQSIIVVFSTRTSVQLSFPPFSFSLSLLLLPPSLPLPYLYITCQRLMLMVLMWMCICVKPWLANMILKSTSTCTGKVQKTEKVHFDLSSYLWISLDKIQEPQ